MADTHNLRDKIARVLSTQTTCDGLAHPSELHFRQADAVLAVLDDVRAVAQVAALREAADPFQNVTGSDTPVFSPATADYLHARADRIAREAGIETGADDE